MQNPGEFEILEYYAGAARLARLGKASGVNVAAMDFLYDKGADNRTKNNSHDMNTNAGFVFLYPAQVMKFYQLFRWCLFHTSCCLFRLFHTSWPEDPISLTEVGLCLGVDGQMGGIPCPIWDLLLNICSNITWINTTMPLCSRRMPSCYVCVQG